MKKQRLPALLSAAVLALGLLAGCRAPEEQSRESQTTALTETEAPTEATSEQEKTTAAETDSQTETETETETEQKEVIDLPTEIKDRYFIFRIWNFTLTPYDAFTKTVDAAAASGFNAIKVHIPWALVQPTKAAPDFAAFDKLIDYVVKEKGMKVAVSLDLTRRKTDALIGSEYIQQDPDGNLCVGGSHAGDRTVISFCSEYAVGLAVDFYKTAVAHYHERYGEDVLFYLPAFNQYCETEYWAGGVYDYSPMAKAAFRAFLKEEYGTINELNRVTGENFASFDAVEPPAVNKTDALGRLWYRFRHDKLKNVIDLLAAAQDAVAPEADLCIQLGCVFDAASTVRGTLAFPSLCENADVLWVDDGPAFDHAWSMDYIRSALPAHVKIAQEIDGPGQVNASPEAYLDQGLTSFLHGATYVSIANWGIDDNYRKYEPVWKEIASTWLGEDAPAILSYSENSPVMEVSLLDRFKQGNSNAAINRYNALSKGEDGKPRFVYIRVTDDLSNLTVTEPIEAYSFPGDFSGEQGKDNWFYRSYRKGQFTDMTYQSEEYWLGEATYTRVMNGSVHPDEYDAAVVFKASKDGRLTYSYQISLSSPNSDGIKYSLLLNGEKVDAWECFEVYLSAGETGAATLTLTVEAGDELAFVVNKHETNAHDTTVLSLTVEYQD